MVVVIDTRNEIAVDDELELTAEEIAALEPVERDPYLEPVVAPNYGAAFEHVVSQATVQLGDLENAGGQEEEGGRGRAILNIVKGIVDALPLPGRKVEAEEEGVPLFVDPEVLAADEKARLELEWPTDKIDAIGPIRSFLHYSHIQNGDRIVRSDGAKMVVFEAKGMEIDIGNIASFAGSLNSLQAHCQFLVRQHQPRLNGFRKMMRGERDYEVGERVNNAAEALDTMLGKMETREGLMDRRFYIICNEENMDEVMAALSRVKLESGILADRALNILMLSSLLGQSPADLPDEEELRMRVTSSYIKTNNGRYRRTIELTRFPRNIQAGFLQSVFNLGIPLDLSMQIWPIPSDEAISNLESQRTKMQASANTQLKKTGQVGSKETIALEDTLRLRDAVMRGNERMFRTLVTVSVHGDSEKQLDEYVGMLQSVFRAILAELDPLKRVQRNGFATTLPLCSNPSQHWLKVDTSTLALMFPFSPGDLDMRRGTYVGLDIRARGLITFDLFDPKASQNMNSAILATSGAGKSFSAKLFMLRQIMRGVRVYVIDPEGEYVDTAHAAGGRVFTPGAPGQGMNPFSVAETGPELNERIGNLKRLVQVMINERLDATVAGALDNAMVEYYKSVTQNNQTGNFNGLFNHLLNNEPEISKMVRPFYNGSSEFLLSDEGADLLSEEPPITVFNLRLVDDEMRAAAGMVCAEVVWTMASRDPRPRMLVADEVWAILAHPEGAGFMINTAKRARKHRLGLMSITQDVQDLLTVNSSDGIRGNSGRALLQNASYKLLLRQDPAVVPTLQETFQLSDELAGGLAGYATGEGLLISPKGFFPIRIEAAKEEAEIIEWTPGMHS